MKKQQLRPGTVFPLLGTLLFFLPERYKEKLCCVTPLAAEVSRPPPPLPPRLCSLLANHLLPPTAPGGEGRALPEGPEGRGLPQ